MFSTSRMSSAAAIAQRVSRRVASAFFLVAALAPGAATGWAEERAVVVMFGDSTTAFRPKAVEKVYSVRVQEAFDEAGEPVRVINRGVGGDNTGGARKRFEKDVLDEKPAVVVIQFGINDSAVDVWKDPPATGPRVSREDYVANLTWMVEKARASGVKVILMTPNPMRWSEKVRQLYGKPPYDPQDPEGFEKPFFRDHVEAMRRLAKEWKVPLVDIRAAYAEHEKATGKKADDLLLDGVHPNDDGHALVAEKLVPVIRRLLEKE